MKTIDELLKNIQKAEITWKAVKDVPTMFEIVFAGEYVRLRMNDFPDEPLFTLFIRDETIVIEERPRGGHLQHRS